MANFSNSPSSYFSKTQQLKQNIGNVGNLYESPSMQSPTTPTTPTSSATPQVTNAVISKPSSSQKPKNNKKTLQFIALGVFALTLIGGGVGLFLMNQSQDTRQQASVPSGKGEIFVQPEIASYIEGDAAQVDLVFTMGEAVPINGVQIVMEITGTIPDDLEFVEESINGLNLQINNMTDITGGKQVRLVYQVAPPGPFVTPSSDLTFGSLMFTSPASGELKISFDATDSKVIRSATNEDVLRTPSQVATYTFEGGEVVEEEAAFEDEDGAVVNSATLTELVATLSGTRQIPVNSSTASGTVKMNFDETTDTFSLMATISGMAKSTLTSTKLQQGSLAQNGTTILDLATASDWVANGNKLELSITNQTLPATQSAALLAGNTYLNISSVKYPNGEIRGQLLADANGIGGGQIPTPTPTPTPLTSSASARLTSVPATTQELPVTGATENTIALILIGIALFGSGFWLINKQG